MPQLDFSYYISQIVWLLISFGLFFFVSKFLILKQLDGIFSRRSNKIETNTSFAENIIKKAKILNEKCDTDIKKHNDLMNEKISFLLKSERENNEKKIDNLRKQLNEQENKNILQIKQEIYKIEQEVKEQVAQIIYDILSKVYLIKPDKNKILELLNKVKN